MLKNVIIALENLRSLYNIGAIYRTAEFFGVKTIALIGYSGKDENNPTDIHKKLAKTSLGTMEVMETIQFENSTQLISKYPKHKVVAIENNVPEVESLYNSWLTENIILVFGNEVDGVSKDTLKIADTIIEIPRVGNHSSLNVSTSAGIVLSYMHSKFG